MKPKSLKIRYKTTEFEMLPITEEQLGNRFAGFDGRVGKHLLKIRVNQLLDNPDMFSVIIERTKEIEEFCYETVFCWVMELDYSSCKQFAPTIFKITDPATCRRVSRKKRWFIAQPIVNEVWKYLFPDVVK